VDQDTFCHFRSCHNKSAGKLSNGIAATLASQHYCLNNLEVAMVDNVDRAEWAEAALELFADMVMPGEVSEETAQDLICDVGHFCRIQLRLSRSEVIALYAAAIGCWSAEDRAADGEPYANDKVEVEVRQVANLI
jgi:hypothetical protein